MKPIDCAHWEDIGRRASGRCRINTYQNPSFGTCIKLCRLNGNPNAPLEVPPSRPIRTARTKVDPCLTCGNRIQRWAGLQWYGYPYPRRLYQWATHPIHPRPSQWPGCGCCVPLKSAWDWLKTTYQSATMEDRHA